jgi:hypothetical protein
VGHYRGRGAFGYTADASRASDDDLAEFQSTTIADMTLQVHLRMSPARHGAMLKLKPNVSCHRRMWWKA